MLTFERIFWQNGTGGACHHADLWPLIAEKVFVYRDDIESLGNKTINLTSGTKVPCDALLCGTGWKPGLEFFTPSLLVSLDLPHNPSDEPSSTTEKWEKLISEADTQICQRFRLLANPPSHFHRKLDTTPYRLYNCMAPLHDDTILFLNHITAGNKLFAAEAQAMWAVAYLNGDVKLPSIQEREVKIAEWVAWCRRRYLSNGERGTFATFDGVGYVDMLLDEMELEGHKKKGWWRYWTEVFFPRDLGAAWKEYLEQAKKTA